MGDQQLHAAHDALEESRCASELAPLDKVPTTPLRSDRITRSGRFAFGDVNADETLCSAWLSITG